MGFRLFGRGKDDDGEASCARCGRTLLAGEWTQRLVEDDGSESYLCSLCVAGGDADVSDEATFETTPAGSGKVRSSRTESDAFWRALKDKDAEIERLESRLARVEAEKQELIVQLTGMRERLGLGTGVPGPDEAAFAGPAPRDGDAAVSDFDPGVTGGVSDAAAAAGPDDLESIESDTDAPPATALSTAIVAPPSSAVPPAATVTADDRTDPGLGEKLRASSAALAAVPAADAADVADASPPIAENPAAPERPPAPPPMADDEGDLGASLTILQRGIDLLNVSAVPRRIVETNDSLGIPTVHVGSEASDTLLVTFLWTMGWYQFRVELADGGRITLAERGYDERTDLTPNASVRGDGTVQIAPAMIKQAAIERDSGPRDEGPPIAPTTTSGTIISKSMMGQRTDDENVPPAWGTKNAPDFDWGR